jgi:hypothetical protein
MSARNRIHPAAILLALAGAPSMAFGDDAPKAEKPPAAKASTAFDPIELRIYPSPAPVPALKYRLFPLEPDRTPGDAAPIYIRVALGSKDAARAEIGEKSREWLNLPPDKFPTAEARKFVDQWSGRLEQIAFGARRQTCNWNYTVNEQKENAIMILLPDAQEMRNLMRLVSIKARVEIAEKKYDDAIRTAETGLAFGQHVGNGPFLISSLVGIACVNVMLAELDGLVAQPDAPNLYWALSALPRPLVSMRAAMENEQKLGEWIVPEINDLDRPRTEGEWSALLGRLHTRLMQFQKTAVAQDGAVIQVGKDVTLAQFRFENLPDAKAHYKSRQRSTEGLSDDEILVRSIAEKFRELRDDWYKLFYLPYPDTAPYSKEVTERVKGNEKGAGALFTALMPTISGVKIAETRPDRKVAALRIIEAIRMHAAAKEGALPASLDEIKLVPIPLDPTTGKPFTYNRVGETATLSAPPPAPGQPALTYRITLKK